MATSGLPKVKPDGQKIEVGWVKQGNKYQSKPNLFSAIVDGKQITVTCLSDQPSGSKKGEQVTWQPQLFLDDVEQPCGKAVLLDTDPTNENYHQNVLEWDYSICKRRIRIIEGRFRERWITSYRGKIEIAHNFEGSLPINLGSCIRADHRPITAQVIGDREIVDTTNLPDSAFPVEIGSSLTVYPDAHVEGATVDGHLVHTEDPEQNWAHLIAGEGTSFGDSDDTLYFVYAYSVAGGDSYRQVNRGMALFDTSGLPDTALVSAATLSLYGVTAATFDDDNLDPDVQV
ncbi:unnamed protein product, partial [marine sediment metagenome]